MSPRAAIVCGAATDVGNVREHNEDNHFADQDAGVFMVCDGMGGHAAGEVASALAVKIIRQHWASEEVAIIADRWARTAAAEDRHALLEIIQKGVQAAHQAIIDEAIRDKRKKGMGTTFVGTLIVGDHAVFAHVGDSRAYLIRDGASVRLTEDHTLLERLQSAGIDVDTTGDGARFRSMLTHALGIGAEAKVSTFLVPLADGDRLMLCSDGISEYLPEDEVGEVVSTQPSPARAAQRLVDLALERGGHDNATALVLRVLEAGDSHQPAAVRRADAEVLATCALFRDLTAQRRLRALRISLEREHKKGDRLNAQSLGDRVCWILMEGSVDHEGVELSPGSLLYPESLLPDREPPDVASLATALTPVRALALRGCDFRELCAEDIELGETVMTTLLKLMAEMHGTELEPEPEPAVPPPVRPATLGGGNGPFPDADEKAKTLIRDTRTGSADHSEFANEPTVRKSFDDLK